MQSKIHHIKVILMSGFFLLLDQVLKYTAISHQNITMYVLKPWIGWEYFPNPGIAFGIPFPQPFLVVITPAIIFALILWWLHAKPHQNTSFHFYMGIALIIGGALSNLVDRALYAITVDYFRVFTSIFNIADVMIVVGCVIVLFSDHFHKK